MDEVTIVGVDMAKSVFLWGLAVLVLYLGWQKKWYRRND